MVQRREVRPNRGRRVIVKRRNGTQWLPILIILLLLIIGGVVAWMVFNNNDENVPVVEGAFILFRLL